MGPLFLGWQPAPVPPGVGQVVGRQPAVLQVEDSIPEVVEGNSPAEEGGNTPEEGGLLGLREGLLGLREGLHNSLEGVEGSIPGGEGRNIPVEVAGNSQHLPGVHSTLDSNLEEVDRRVVDRAGLHSSPVVGVHAREQEQEHTREHAREQEREHAREHARVRGLVRGRQSSLGD